MLTNQHNNIPRVARTPSYYPNKNANAYNPPIQNLQVNHTTDVELRSGRKKKHKHTRKSPFVSRISDRSYLFAGSIPSELLPVEIHPSTANETRRKKKEIQNKNQSLGSTYANYRAALRG